MGCVSSKGGVPVTPVPDHSGVFRDNLGSGRARVAGSDKKARDKKYLSSGESARVNSVCGSDSSSVSFRLGNLQKYVEGEHVAAGWPVWLSAVAGEAIHGWLPLKADTFEKLEKIGQGTYSSVFRARDNETGKIVALKKVRFETFEPESVRFMAREILILRRLDHPNVMKLEGIITSKLSCSIYLVFDYMEHDLAGLISCPNIKFTESQVKCYMKQLLSGIEHCHSRGIMHRDIKGSNVLVNNEGILKVADFGLANFCSTSHKQPLTSRVVTLWYRPPELLLGSTNYGPSIDLWSVGCVFAEVLLGKPLLRGRTEVEQLHKIFKLCGSPPDDYWKKSKLPHATLFKPQQRYTSCLVDTCKELPRNAVNLIQTLLSVEPYKRGTASSALSSDYFTTKPYACDPSSMPKFPPNKEIDAKGREEARRKKASARVQELETSRKTTKKPSGVQTPGPSQEFPLPSQPQDSQRIKVNGNLPLFQQDENVRARDPPKPTVDRHEEASHSKNASQGDVPFSGPIQVPGSSGFAWVKNRRDDASFRSHRRSGSKLNFNGLDNYLSSFEISNSDLKKRQNGDVSHGGSHSKGKEYYDVLKETVRKHWSQFDHNDSFEGSDEYHSQDLSLALYQKEINMKRNHHMGEEEKVEFSGPLLSQINRADEHFLERHERRIRKAVRRSLFQRGKKEGKRKEHELRF